MRSTHACTPSFAHSSSQYSRRLLSILAHQTKKLTKVTQMYVERNYIVTLLEEKRRCDFLTSAQLCTKEKKCGAHMHVHHLSQLFFAIFTSVVVYSRTTTKVKNITNTVCLACSRYVMFFAMSDHSHHSQIKERSEKKKCGAHTHAHHLSQLSCPIFTSVVVYSRTTQSKFIQTIT